jgi:hypothetical protein
MDGKKEHPYDSWVGSFMESNNLEDQGGGRTVIKFILVKYVVNWPRIGSVVSSI